jgi:membrane carboxypeptidase/penicillin-binding protein
VHGIAVTGGSFPARIWSEFMTAATQPRKPSDDVSGNLAPPALVECRICEDSKLLANPRCPRVTVQDLLPTQVPRQTCKLH